ncbi:MAG: hypothetical protein ACREMQ_16360, partial [Longimicrobiales bacterium]
MTAMQSLKTLLGLTLALATSACGDGFQATATSADLADVEWTHYANDAGGTKYSPLDQIDRGNVATLQVAWTARAGDFPPERFDAAGHRAGNRNEDGTPVDARQGAGCGACHGSQIRFETTPLMRDSTLYLSTPINRVLALDPATGTTRWTFDPHIDITRGYSEDLISRGVSSWNDDAAAPGTTCARRIFLATIGARLFALDAATGT